MNDIKCAIDAHVQCLNICIQKAQYDYRDEWNVRKKIHFPKFNEYHGYMVDSILKSHESFFLNDGLMGMCSIPLERTNINI
jgi:hypothetical protein